MFEAVGHAVSRLIRIRYGAMMLPRGLKRGAWMELDEGDIRSLMKVAGTRSVKGGDEGRGEVAAGGPRRAGAGQELGGRSRSRGSRGNGPRSSGGSQRNVPNGAGVDVGQGYAQGAGQSRKNRPESADRQGGGAQPDPMKTSLGYIGADSFTRQRQDQGQRRGAGSGSGGGVKRRGGRGR